MVRAALERLAAAAPREDEVDRRQHVQPLQLVDHMQQVVGGQAAVPADAVRGLLLLRAFGPRALIDAAVLFEEREEAVVYGQPHLQLDRPDVVEHSLHAAAVLGHPVGDLAVVSDGGRQADELDRQRCLDDDLLPHGSAWEVVDVVDLVEHDVTDEVEARRILVDEVAQDLRGHHHHGGVIVDGVLARDQSDRGFAVGADEVVKLLVAQRLERRGVKDLRSLVQGAKDGVLGDDRLAARRGGAHQDASPATIQLLDGLALECVEVERQRGLEFRDQQARRFFADGAHSWINSVETLVIRAPSLCDSM